MSPFISPVTPAAGLPSWSPTFTRREALRLGMVTKDQFEACDLIARTVVEDHMRAGTERHLWEPNLTHIQQIVAPYLADAASRRETRIADEIDPVVQQMHDALENARADLDSARAYPCAIELIENGGTIPGERAPETVRDMEDRVARETVEGATIHNRTSPFWRLVALWLPGLEGLAAGSFLAWNLDVPLITPWQDPLGVLLVIVFVAVIVGLQPRLITAAATAHNQARENRHNQNRRAAEEGYRTRNRHLIAVSTIAAVITGGMIYRSLAALADHSPAVVGLMVGFSLAAGIGLPALAYVLKAFDGSRLSRQTEAATGDLHDDVREYDGYRADAAGHLALVNQLGTELVTHTIPVAQGEIQQALDPARDCYEFVRAQIGGLPEEPVRAAVQTIVPAHSRGGSPMTVSTRVHGSHELDMMPIRIRVNAAEQHMTVAKQLTQALNGLPEHPWTCTDG